MFSSQALLRTPGRVQSRLLMRLRWRTTATPALRYVSSAGMPKHDSASNQGISGGKPSAVGATLGVPKEQEKTSPGGCVDDEEHDDNDDMEQEEMFVEAHESFEHRTLEWGGPRRGGRFPEPTRFGDWERKGRCTDF